MLCGFPRSARRMGKSVVYVTDPEGNLAYFARCITQSNGAYLEDGELLLRKGWLFVVRALARARTRTGCLLYTSPSPRD